MYTCMCVCVYIYIYIYIHIHIYTHIGTTHHISAICYYVMSYDIISHEHYVIVWCRACRAPPLLSAHATLCYHIILFDYA